MIFILATYLLGCCDVAAEEIGSNCSATGATAGPEIAVFIWL
jgi:hypothetical protein